MNHIVWLVVCCVLMMLTATSLVDCQLQKRKLSSAPELDCQQLPKFSQQLRSEIRNKTSVIQRIVDYVLEGEGRGKAYEDLALFCDTYGPRMSGSESLSRALDHMFNRMSQESGLVSRKEKAMIPKWEVGRQFAAIVRPVAHNMTILALGASVGTGNRSLVAEAVLVSSFEELDALGRASRLTGKIVVYRYEFTTYGESVKFRSQGAARAAKYGAVAALVRSVTPFSIYSPHAGMGSRSIPTAAITVEDADKIKRWLDRNQTVVLEVFIEAQNYDDVESFNLIGDIPGKERPEEVVLVSGHIDSWYNTDGAMDDGGGMMIAYKALDTLKRLNIVARRTMRAILWTSEEFGLVGAQQYYKDHKSELDSFKVVMESDLGTFRPLGLSFRNFGPLGQCVLKELLSLTGRLDTNHLDENYEGSDVEVFSDNGVPGLSLANENSKYFYFHHTSGDSITLEDPAALDRATALWAIVTYVLADIDVADYRD